MIDNIKEILKNAQLQQQIKEATNLAEAIKLITTAGSQKGYSFTQESVAQVVSGLMLGEHELTEADLLAVAGGLRGSAITGLSFYDCCW
ncbi:MAG: Nif11-like leader peptide family natural product precursor [Aulosira sp. DedQUE10]|nr:Nif11-like leader peptide family natural product precursor [Aulosira sp. DedQUE10]